MSYLNTDRRTSGNSNRRRSKVYVFERRDASGGSFSPGSRLRGQRSAGQEGEVTGVHDEAGVQVQAL